LGVAIHRAWIVTAPADGPAAAGRAAWSARPPQASAATPRRALAAGSAASPARRAAAASAVATDRMARTQRRARRGE
jgi:hypothetical protein